MSNTLKLSSFQAKEIHVQNRLSFQSPSVVLTGSNTQLLFRRVDTLESEVAQLFTSGGGGSGGAMEVYFPSYTSNNFETLTSQLLLDAPLSAVTAYNTLGRFAFPDTVTALSSPPFSLPTANSNTHFRIFNETDLNTFPINTSLILTGTNSDLTEINYSITSELVSARNINGTWTFYSGS
jgi:hypothetical protein